MRLFPTLGMLACIALSASAGLAADDKGPRPLDAAGWQQLLAAHKGRPAIVHFWGLTCGNCMVELKDWGSFAEKHPNTVVVVNWDARGGEPARVDAALAKAGLGNAPSYALAGGFEEKLRFAVDRDWMGELPYTRLIASDGTATTFSGAADFEELSQWLAAEDGKAK